MLSYLLATLTFAGIYAMLALGLNVIWGMTGMINLGLAGFFAVGAYVSALVSIAGVPIPLAALCAMAAAALVGGRVQRRTEPPPLRSLLLSEHDALGAGTRDPQLAYLIFVEGQHPTVSEVKDTLIQVVDAPGVDHEDLGIGAQSPGVGVALGGTVAAEDHRVQRSFRQREKHP